MICVHAKGRIKTGDKFSFPFGGAVLCLGDYRDPSRVLSIAASDSLRGYNRVQKPTVEQCRRYAAEYKARALDRNISPRRATVLTGISRSWTTLANKLEHLAEIVKEE